MNLISNFENFGDTDFQNMKIMIFYLNCLFQLFYFINFNFLFINFFKMIKNIFIEAEEFLNFSLNEKNLLFFIAYHEKSNFL